MLKKGGEMATQVITIRVENDLYETLKADAESARKTLSEHARTLLESAFAAQKTSEELDVLKQLLWTKYLLLRYVEKQFGSNVATSFRDASKADAEQALNILESRKKATAEQINEQDQAC